MNGDNTTTSPPPGDAGTNGHANKEEEGEDPAVHPAFQQQHQQHHYALKTSDVYPPSWFTDDQGNLKFVNLVVRHPCKLFWAILLLVLVITFLLISVVLSDGNPFADPGSEYDVHDVRSIE